MKKLLEIINEFSTQNPLIKIYVGICTTSFKEKKRSSYTAFPKKIKKNLYYFHCVFSNDHEANNFIQSSSNIISKFFLDVEQKNDLFKWKKIVTLNPNILFLKIQPNQITVDCILDTVLKKNNSKVLVIGSGNIASSICLKLKLLKWDFSWVVDESRVSKSGGFMDSFFKSHKLKTNNIKFEYIVNTVPIKLKLDYENFVSKQSKFLEVTGNSLEFLKKLECSILRIDVSNHLIAELKKIIYLKENTLGYGRKKLGKKFICSGGYIGKKGDIIVNNIRNPEYIIGVCDGMGGFQKRLNINYNIKFFYE